MKKARRSLASLMFLMAMMMALARPPFLRDLIVPMVAARLGVAVSLEDAGSQGLLEGIHIHSLAVASVETPSDTFLKVGTLRVFAGGQSLWNPRRVLLEHATLSLRFNEQGVLETRLPSPSSGSARPLITLRDSNLVITQGKRPPWTLSGISGAMVPAEGGYHLEATVEDPALGVWKVSGLLSDSPRSLEITAQAERTRLHMPELVRIPFIKPVTWDHVSLEGEASCVLRLKSSPLETRASLELSRPDLLLTVNIIGLTCRVSQGRATIEPGLVKLQGLTGEGVGGRLAAPSATLDFRKQVPRLEFSITGSNLDGPSLAGLAKSRVARNLRLSGEIRFSVLLANTGPVFEGIGDGTIHAGILGLPWHLASRQGHLEFTGPFGLKFSTRR